MGDRQFPFEIDAACDRCGTLGAFDIMGDYLCSRHVSTGDDEEDAQDMRDELDLLREENQKLRRMLKTRDNKIKHLKSQLSESRLRRRIEHQQERMAEQGRVIEQLKREKAALHAYAERAEKMVEE